MKLMAARRLLRRRTGSIFSTPLCCDQGDWIVRSSSPCRRRKLARVSWSESATSWPLPARC